MYLLRKEGCLMATNKIAGKNFSLDGGIIELYGVKGIKSRGKVAVNAFGGDLMVEVDSNDSLLSDIQTCFNDDTEAGNGDKIAMLIAKPLPAVFLFLEGIITSRHLREANEFRGVIDLPSVEILGRSLIVRIDPDSDYSIATADANGDIL